MPRPVIHDLSKIKNPISEFEFSNSVRVLILIYAKKHNIKIATRKIKDKLIVYNLS